MIDIFKTLCQDTIQERRFGICDDRPNHRAYIDIANGQKWIATFDNPFQYQVTFTALDNCIEMKDSNGKKMKRCEGILSYESTIIFVEAKMRSGDAKTWARDADKQLRTTITAIQQKIDLSDFPNKKAAITNGLQRGLSLKHSVRIKKFFIDTGYALTVNKRIVLE